MDLPYYHGGISKLTGETLLLRKGKKGSYLLRDSETASGVLCLCILVGRIIYTYRIFQNSHGQYMVQTAEGVKEKYFHNLKDLIAYYEKPNKGLMHFLSIPVNKNEAEQIQIHVNGTIKHMLLLEDTYAEVDERDYVEVLPS
ncbi:PREDICTED: SH2 domain-containing protein 1B-like [Nanorana parkeri]|uniref:SH2 domain-containing protein 1B-like n=1 Tax=Nanorana parkeri TaxID=125878 RepID=UPI00085478E4|nr:PREDICTED: SH2 domain-containing protein 1B-like [Nanorana parkeri]